MNMRNDMSRFRVRHTAGIFLVILLVLGACLPEPLEVKGIPGIKPQIVVSSQIVPDESLVVFLTKSFGALEASATSDPEALFDRIAINDAIVVVHHATEADTLIFLGRGAYGGVDIAFIEEVSYTLHVHSPTMGSVTATTEVRPQVSFTEIKGELYFNGYDDTLAQITYSFNDPPVKNWYMINVLKIDTAELRSNLLNPRDFTRLLDDTELSEPSYNETFRVFPREFAKGDTIAVYLSNISEEYFQFIRLRLDNRFGFFEYVSEPINYPSNVVGGRGFFNLYIPDIRLIVLE
jgi:hypothetical protein